MAPCTPWWMTVGVAVWWMLTRIFAPFMSAALPALITYGLLYPNAADVAALKVGKGEAALLVGISGDGRNVGQRIYMVYPRVFARAGEAEVDEKDGTRTVWEDKGGAAITLAVWALCVFASWRFLVSRVFGRRLG